MHNFYFQSLNYHKKKIKTIKFHFAIKHIYIYIIFKIKIDVIIEKILFKIKKYKLQILPVLEKNFYPKIFPRVDINIIDKLSMKESLDINSNVAG